MPKFYLSKSNSQADQNEAQTSSTDYAILLNGSQARFFKNGTHIKNLNYSGYQQPTQNTFERLGASFKRFFSGNTANTDMNNNAFAYMNANMHI